MTSPAYHRVQIFRAQGIPDEDAVRAVVIIIAEPMPERITRDQARAFYASEGAALADAIWSSCPGGTVDALIAALMARRAEVPNDGT